MKFENTEVYGFKRALKGMRNPLESWRKNDTVEENGKVVIGENDLDLAQRRIRSVQPRTVHRQCTNLRQHLLLPSVLKLTITIQSLIMTVQNLVM